ncbi:GGDEF domain-containing protein [Desulfobacter latus]|uniref:diguanylate cyclase n=1 Tax=Desulfobacter latus TaxID=2292 RepID=A0A850TE57_9BACT|nr:GGDEF domain-containing protein [Desulfobacter latus]NWH05716.1 diguanylate cyclase [Desulfobacter latus]
MVEQRNDKTEQLQAEIIKLRSQKDHLLKELDTVEAQYENIDSLYRRYFPIILDALSQDSTAFGKACIQLATAMRKKASPVKIEYIFGQIKTAMIHEDVSPVAAPPKKGFLSYFRKNSSEDQMLENLRQSYQDVVNQLKSILDQKYTQKLESITSNLLKIEEIQDFEGVRENIFSLIFNYITETSQDREKVNAFIRDIVSRIFEIEKKLVSSYEQTNSLLSSNQGLESILNDEMAGIKDSFDAAESIDDLRAKISTGLSSIEKALEKKQKVDQAISRLAEKSKNSFTSGFARLKQELHSATKYSEELEKKLNEDQLTSAKNRRAYDKKIQEEMDRFLRYKTIFSLLLIDVDKFKNINDTYGHAIGDRCLQEIIKRTQPLLRKNDMLARYGGEEFVVIMPETDTKSAMKVAEKIRRTIEKIEFLYKKENVRLTVSIGVSCIKDGDTSPMDLFGRADMAVYKAKENGRNQVITQ